MAEKQNSFNIIIGFILITALFIAGGAYIVAVPDEQLKAGGWVTHTHEVLNELETLSLHINEVETNGKEYAAVYNESVSEIRRDITDFRHLTIDNHSQQVRVARLERDLDNLMGSLKKKDVRQKKAIPTPDTKLETQISKQIDDMKAEENRLLLMRIQTWHEEADNAREAFIAGEIILYLLVCLFGGALLNLAAQRKKIIAIERNAATLQKKKAEHLNEILRAQRAVVGNSANMQIALQTMSDKAKALINAEGSVIEMLEGEEMVYYAASGSGASFIGLRIKVQGSFSGLCVRSGNVLKCDDSETDNRVDRVACRKVGLRSMVVVPLRHHDIPIGVLKVMSSKAFAFSEDDVATLELMAGLLSGVLSDVIAANAMRLSNLELSAANINLEKMATTDGLTGLQNRRTFQEFLSREYELAVRHKKQLSLIILDVDHFKKYNDGFGHPAGDAVLQKVGALLKQVARKSDCVARYGGEEFVMLLSETGPDEAMVMANRIQQIMANEKWEHRQVTVSVGVSSLGGAISNAAELLETADKALYAAKEGGRNRVVRYAR